MLFKKYLTWQHSFRKTCPSNCCGKYLVHSQVNKVSFRNCPKRNAPFGGDRKKQKAHGMFTG